MKRLLAIQSLSVVGRSGLAVMAPVISALGCQCCPLPTAVLSTHTGFQDPVKANLARYFPAFARHYQELGIRFDTVSVSYLADSAQAAQIAEVIDCLSDRFILDPVLGDGGRYYRGITDAHAQALRQLCGKADILLPNLTEAAALTGRSYRDTGDPEALRLLCRELMALGVKAVLLTGIPWDDDTVGFFGMDAAGEFSYRHPRHPQSLHGTGDLFTAALAGGVTRGLSLPDAGELAADFVQRCLEATPAATLYGVEFEKVLPFLTQNAGIAENNC